MHRKVEHGLMDTTATARVRVGQVGRAMQSKSQPCHWVKAIVAQRSETTAFFFPDPPQFTLPRKQVRQRRVSLDPRLCWHSSANFRRHSSAVQWFHASLDSWRRVSCDSRLCWHSSAYFAGIVRLCGANGCLRVRLFVWQRFCTTRIRRKF